VKKKRKSPARKPAKTGSKKAKPRKKTVDAKAVVAAEPVVVIDETVAAAETVVAKDDAVAAVEPVIVESDAAVVAAAPVVVIDEAVVTPIESAEPTVAESEIDESAVVEIETTLEQAEPVVEPAASEKETVAESTESVSTVAEPVIVEAVAESVEPEVEKSEPARPAESVTTEIEPVPEQAEPDTDGLKWCFHPFRTSTRRSVGVVIFLVALCVLVQVAFADVLLTVLTVLILFISLRDFFLPSRYLLNTEGVEIMTPLGTVKRIWRDFGAFRVGRAGIFLKDRSDRAFTFFTNRRGNLTLFLPEAEQEIREHVIGFIKNQVEQQDTGRADVRDTSESRDAGGS